MNNRALLACILLLVRFVATFNTVTNDNTTTLTQEFGGRSAYTTWTFTPSLEDNTQTHIATFGVGYLECLRPTRTTILGEVILADPLLFTIKLWKVGIREYSTFSFSYSLLNQTEDYTQVNIADAEYFFPFGNHNHLYKVMLNDTYLSLTDEKGTYSFTHFQPTSPLWILAAAVAVTISLFACLVQGGYQQKSLHPLGRTLLSGKLVGLAVLTFITAPITLQLRYSAVFMIVMVFVNLFAVAIGIITAVMEAPGKVLRWWPFAFVVVFIVELLLFGNAYFQYTSSLLLLVLQLYTKYTTVQSESESRMFTFFFMACTVFNGLWMVFPDNYYRIESPDPTIMKAFFMASALLVLFRLKQCTILMLPKYELSSKQRIKDSAMGQCGICAQNIGPGNVFLAPCNHSFHAECMDQWLEKKNVCPLDKSAIDASNHSWKSRNSRR